ncbi:MAG: bifunctional 4-hydroxy-2-oxoglutarate aldolase/2-dehydro-3-deoxy-phosphogluconate aldolase [Firmicutes bacterium]|jgi:2-dehydro-3-deoxyphosphogluconate aldolase/(4S)-4-hydroxy-2-oxoglutarate aldolase|nr:bifunctional 4-hydroxy-2-oxoglutarate aldolase/2-dehydro-3-deoxy-phosphogluconate aldolase [Bacillota bacterium]MDH7494813.1 bifunctional 4-hydroxy-2-oxoglutarate aldolase/2-dehydro-3-deoxy-phosphogluconate aldolase [Bacillota bacterium]
MNREETLALIKETGIVAIIRGIPAEGLAGVTDALKAAGVRAIEVTMNTSQALDMVAWLARYGGRDVAIGSGTVLDSETARSAMLAGASFIISPSLNAKMLEMCHRYGVLTIPGVLTPSEVLTAWELGASLVKIFPAGRLGPGYVKDLRGPFPHIEMVAVGGVTQSNAAEFLKAGCVAVGVGSELVDRQLVTEKRFDVIGERAAAFVKAVRSCAVPNTL